MSLADDFPSARLIAVFFSHGDARFQVHLINDVRSNQKVTCDWENHGDGDVLEGLCTLEAGFANLDALAFIVSDFPFLEEVQNALGRILVRAPFLNSTACALVGGNRRRLLQKDHRTDVHRPEGQEH